MLVPASAVEASQTAGRSTDLDAIQTALESKIIRAKLDALGLTDAEIQARLSRLSDKQIHQFASQIRAVHPAGDVVVELLLVVVLVLLILYLAKRL